MLGELVRVGGIGDRVADGVLPALPDTVAVFVGVNVGVPVVDGVPVESAVTDPVAVSVDVLVGVMVTVTDPDSLALGVGERQTLTVGVPVVVSDGV